MKLDTQRLILREVEATDVDAMFAWQVDLRYLEHYPVERTSRQDTLDLVGRFIGWKLERPRWRWQLAISLPISGELIGSCGVRRAEPDSPSADIGYELNPDHWGHGYATEAVGRNVAFAFDEVGTAKTMKTLPEIVVPILDVQLVGPVAADIRPGLAQRIAEATGRALDSRP